MVKFSARSEHFFFRGLKGLSFTNYKIVKNSKSEPKNLSRLCTFNIGLQARKPERSKARVATLIGVFSS